MMITKLSNFENTLMVFAKNTTADFRNMELLKSKVKRLFILAKRNTKFAETECNREVSNLEVMKNEKCQKEIMDIMFEIIPGSKVTFSGDPRGDTVKVILPQGQYNTMGGEESGWGIE